MLPAEYYAKPFSQRAEANMPELVNGMTVSKCADKEVLNCLREHRLVICPAAGASDVKGVTFQM